MRLTRKVFNDLLIWMIGFGLSIGLVFPFFVLLLGVSAEVALTPTFFAACLGAGVMAGLINYGLAKGIVGGRLRTLVEVGERMRELARSVRQVNPESGEIEEKGPTLECSADTCLVQVDSDDEFGHSAESFNQLVQALGHSVQTEHAVRTFSDMLARQLDLDTLAHNTLEHLLKFTASEGGALLVEHDGKLEVRASHGLKDAGAVAESKLLHAVVHEQRGRVVQTPEGVKLDGVLSEFDPREVMVLPVLHKGVTLGAIVLATSERFTEESKVRLHLFRQAIAMALNNALAHDRLQRLAARDELTGVYNRRFGMGRLREEYKRSVRSGQPLGVVMLDIDHFKKVNDTYGHIVGDRVLKRVAEASKVVLREGDVLVRYGGEEFMAVLPAASCEDVQIISERIRRTVKDTVISHGAQQIRVTLSLGGTAYPELDVKGEEDLLKRADELLYKAKEEGRDRVIIGA